jgi:phage shock protein C
MSEKRLVRRQDDRMFLGVAGGIADYLGIDPAIVRVLFVLLTLAKGWGLLLYFILAIIMPVGERVRRGRDRDQGRLVPANQVGACLWHGLLKPPVS